MAPAKDRTRQGEKGDGKGCARKEVAGMQLNLGWEIINKLLIKVNARHRNHRHYN